MGLGISKTGTTKGGWDGTDGDRGTLYLHRESLPGKLSTTTERRESTKREVSRRRWTASLRTGVRKGPRDGQCSKEQDGDGDGRSRGREKDVRSKGKL